ncbi:MAG: VanZ family protein [Clostridia bacterium]|nr:VanZ family protein [Clostridia bacterium]
MQAHNAFERGTDPELNMGTDPTEKGSVPMLNNRRAIAVPVIFCVLTALWIAFIFSNSLTPAATSEAQSGQLLNTVQSSLPRVSERGLRKAAHFGEFGILGVLGMLTCIAVRKRRSGPQSTVISDQTPHVSSAGRLLSAGWVLAAGILVAVVDETLQYLVPGRSPEVADVLLDIAGFVAGALIATGVAAAVKAIAAARRPR